MKFLIKETNQKITFKNGLKIGHQIKVPNYTLERLGAHTFVLWSDGSNFYGDVFRNVEIPNDKRKWIILK